MTKHKNIGTQIFMCRSTWPAKPLLLMFAWSRCKGLDTGRSQKALSNSAANTVNVSCEKVRLRLSVGPAIIAGLCALCVLASLSGCLTAAKIGEWQRAVYGWGMDPGASKPCQVASAEASAYLANANQRLAEAGKLTDLASDSRARELVTSAALACGRRMP